MASSKYQVSVLRAVCSLDMLLPYVLLTCRRNRLDLDVQRVPCERGNTQNRPGGEVRLDELVFHFAEGGQVVFDIDVVGYQFHQVLEAQAFMLQNRAQALEGH